MNKEAENQNNNNTWIIVQFLPGKHLQNIENNLKYRKQFKIQKTIQNIENNSNIEINLKYRHQFQMYRIHLKLPKTIFNKETLDSK